MLIENKKAHFNYEFLEKLEVGIELFGFEVKSLRSKLGSLEGGHVVIRGMEAFLINTYIPAFQPKNAPQGFDERRPRKLLLTKKELQELVKIEAKKGLTIVPISVYNKGRKIKVSIAIARGKKKFDKRETLKKRDADRDIQREMKER
ncbi:MAG: SsrA-binding protein [Candidatus Taylorbacteria bacterium CG11_big_fil_rev_8_21_14_0_20_46_11]|uniref:SsrA-binding protein n=1 Tax=Candidatus Taylorbacteria bacterium CG11_big_fil_rev_8_21_14_0_20_46_11 TaxID=1975025 RepID=A0A2H0KD52_9BACT|nr:MAG: SsrA-binding protein [Candidatus Taylorbacteria bacterium CG11_big_fil_rev_8_21_14_0_20_46_11]